MTPPSRRYLLQHAASKNYKGLLKAVLRAAMEPLNADDAKEVEQAVSGGRHRRAPCGCGHLMLQPACMRVAACVHVHACV